MEEHEDPGLDLSSVGEMISSAKETQHPDVKTLFTEARLPARVWMTSTLLAGKLCGLERWEKERGAKVNGISFLVSY